MVRTEADCCGLKNNGRTGEDGLFFKEFDNERKGETEDGQLGGGAGQEKELFFKKMGSLAIFAEVRGK